MGWLDNLFGGGAKQRDATAAYNDSQATLQAGLDKALAELKGSTEAGRAALNTGYDQANVDLNRASGIYDKALGIYDRASGLYDQALPGLRNDITQGYAGAEAALTSAADRANAVLDPYARSGRGAQDLYDRALGVAGTDAQKAFYDQYAANDPYRAYRDELANKQIQRQFNASGLGNSGRAGMAISRASLERGSQDLQQYLSRLEAAGARGSQIAGQQGANIQRAGEGIAQNRAAQGTGLANLGLNVLGAKTGIAGQQAGVIGQQAGIAGQQATMAAQRARDLAGLESGQGSQLSSLIYGNAQQSAGNRINLGNAYAQSRGIGAQNLINLAGTAAQAYSLYNNPLRKIA